MAHPTVLVTGGAGYIGSHACLALHEAGYLPISYDDLSAGHRWAAQWGPLVVGDIRDTGALTACIRQWNCQAVMHFASRISVAESVAEPDLYYDVNVRGSQSLLDAMAAAGLRHLVFSSSAAVYGDGLEGPIPESAAIAPKSPYGANKAEAEQLIAAWCADQRASISLRYFNAAGADPESRIGEAHMPETHLIPLALAAAEAGTPLRVFGTDYPTPDGSCIRDYVHVTDIAAAHVAALRALSSGRCGSASINLGTGIGVSVLDVLRHAGNAVGRAVHVEVAPRRAGDPASLVASNDRAREELDWNPSSSTLERVIADAWRWMKTPRHQSDAS